MIILANLFKKKKQPAESQSQTQSGVFECLWWQSVHPATRDLWGRWPCMHTGNGCSSQECVAPILRGAGGQQGNVLGAKTHSLTAH